MEEKSDIEIIRGFAQSTHRSIEVREIQYLLSGIRKLPRYKRMVYVPFNADESSYFVWYNDPYTQIGINTFFCGAFIPLSSRISSKVVIRNRILLDRLNINSKAKKNITGNRHFDSKVLISGELNTATKRFLRQSKIQDQILASLKLDTGITIVLNRYNVDFVPGLKNKSYLAILNSVRWYLKRDDIEPLFIQIEKLRRIINGI